jgi:hypothetical protein
MEALYIALSNRGQTTRGGPPAWGLVVGLTTPHSKKKLVTKTSKEPRTWTDFLDKRPKLWNKSGRIILGWILERWDGVMWTGLVWLRIGTGGELL